MSSSGTAHRHMDGHRRAKLRWRCRRGLKELDLLLERFLERGFEDLSSEQLIHFEALLESPDQDLVDWIGGGASPESAHLAEIARCIRWRVGIDPGGTSAESVSTSDDARMDDWRGGTR